MWTGYRSDGCWDEVVGPDGRVRPGCDRVVQILDDIGDGLIDRQASADVAIKAMGITFTVYSEGQNIDRAWPFDIIPRVITTDEWARISEGLVQRLTALNAFIDDLYNDQRIIREGVVPREVLDSSVNYRPECRGISPKGGVWAHISGSDLVRDQDGVMYVLEDNLRVPSGVSYMLENRAVTKRVLAEAFFDLDIHPIDGYPNALRDTLADLSPRPVDDPVICVLTPGVFNSAYFEHAFLAQEMGAHLVEGTDLFVDDDGSDGPAVFLRTVEGPVRVDVIYRRIDDAFIDPEAFRPDSVLGVPGLLRAWRAGTVALANAPGAGVADDKVVYAYVPDIIRFYLDADPLIPNVPTFLCSDEAQRSHVLANLDELVVKPANESGGYGLFIGPKATAAEKAEVRERILADPRNHIAQPTLSLSTAPTLRDGRIVPRHLDLRPFILSGPKPYVTNGGLTRVALVEGSLVVNSSQGGGSKDTWIVDPNVHPMHPTTDV
ncbi:circularly permuted type 2 ATP-grasp protein [Euzebya sp.]|uniref:circularly permuted type 2 ATP-grasp protein n=1 Tax=Euzebya sp. TaxID=1971409 RepID=UPI003517133B